MMKNILVFLAGLLCSMSAVAQTQIPGLGAAAPLSATDQFPVYQGSAPMLRTTGSALKAFSSPIDWVNVKNPGNGLTPAVGDGKYFFDGYMGIGSSTLTTKLPIATLTESGSTVTVTFTSGNTNGGPPIGAPPPFYYNWKPGGTIVIQGASPSGYNGNCTYIAPTAAPASNLFTCTLGTTGLGSGTGGSAHGNAPFVSGDVGKLICVANTNTSAVAQKCGTIAGFTDAEDVTLSFSNASGVATGPTQYTYGTSDQAALTAIFSSAAFPDGAHVYYPEGLYVMTGEIDIPLNGNWTIQGNRTGFPPDIYVYVGLVSQSTGMVYLTLSAPSGSAAIYIGKGESPTSDTSGSNNFGSQVVRIQDFALIGGAGWGQDGGGLTNTMTGIFMAGVNNTIIDDVAVNNFNGDCYYINSVWQGVRIQSSVGFRCNGDGVDVSIGQNYVITSSYFQHNGSHGIKMSQHMNATGAGVVIGNTVQANLYAFGLGPGVVMGNYIEQNGFGFTMADSGGAAAATVYEGNTDYDTVTSQIVFSVATTPLPICIRGPLAHSVTLVSDATACTNGTTYTGGGATQCRVQCDGTNWIETGAGGY